MLRSTLFALLTPFPIASAQVAETWNVTIAQPAYGVTPLEALVEPDGASTSVGTDTMYVDGFGAYRSHAAIWRVDAQGVLLWHRTLALPSTLKTEFTDVAAGPEGSFYASGSTLHPGATRDLVLARYGADGTPLWSIRYDTVPIERAAAVATAANGDAWVVGTSGSNLLLMRVSHAGSIVFARTWGSSTPGVDVGNAIVADPVAGAYVAGRTGSFGGVQGVLVMRVDDAGNELWSRTQTAFLSKSWQALGSDLALDPGGNVYVTGTYTVGSVPQPGVEKYDATGNRLWLRTAQDSTHSIGYGHRIAIDARGDIVTTGMWIGPGDSELDVLVRKYDTSGNVVWTTSWVGPGGIDYPRAFALDSAGEIAVAGVSVQESSPYVTDGIVLRLDRDGRLLWSRVVAGLLSDWSTGVGFGPAGSVVAVSALSGSNHTGLVVRYQESSVPFCFGDGSGSACPCGNATPAFERAGCSNSLGVGGRLTADGSASLANDTLTLRGSAMPNASALYFQGTTPTSAVFGDGLRCASGAIVRLKTLVNTSGASQYPSAGDAAVSVRGSIASPGTRTYQVWYRNAAAFCTSDTFNLTNGVSVTWTN